MSALTSGIKIALKTNVRTDYGAMEKTADGLGRSYRVHGYHIADIELWIDSAALIRMLGSKAARSGKATLGKGAIVARAVNRRKETKA